MTVFSRADWQARPPERGPGPLNPALVEGLVFHWPAMQRPVRGVDAVAAALRDWQAYHMDDRGWSDIAYQAAVDQDGNTWILRGLRTTSAANGNTDANLHYGALLLILAPGEEPSRAMVTEVRRLVKRHRTLFPSSGALLGHGDVRPEPTDCPGPAVTVALAAGRFEPRIWTRGRDVDAALEALRSAKSKARPGSPRRGFIRGALAELRKVRGWWER